MSPHNERSNPEKASHVKPLPVPPGKTAHDVAIASNNVECARLLATTFSDLPKGGPRVGWRKGQRSGKDISCGREGVPIPWVNEVDDEPFPRCENVCLLMKQEVSLALSCVFGCYSH